MPHQQQKALALTVAHNPQKALADWGAASNLFYTMGDTRLLSSLPWRKAFSDYIFNRNNQEKKRKQITIARGIFGSLAPLLGLGNCRLSLGLWYRADDTGT